MYDLLAYLVVPDLFFPLRFAIYFPRMLWALQWLSSTPTVPSPVVQDKSLSPLRILSLSWRSTGCFGWRKTLSMVSPFTHQGY